MAASSSKIFGRGCRALMSAAKTSVAAEATNASAAKKGILKPVQVSPALGRFLGAVESSRGDAVKKVWAHIKSNNLQNPANKKEIFCDEKLKSIFEGKDQVGFLEIARLLSKHFPKTA
ncbi:hypothetical protein RJ639_037352 [Escallonia herrerae]|uniref:DM2 domain-containing protein n=1 Tax=Escallonia herrerae TaxID=1293975 RepID=A0AA88WWV4_9ASTE|nr:hypothetical protein RJ639_037352 [Escallonia herrerae]